MTDMIWEEFLNKRIGNEYNGQVLTDIECPKCGRHIYLDKTIILTSYPCKYKYWCSCGWTGSAHEMWIGESNCTNDEAVDAWNRRVNDESR